MLCQIKAAWEGKLSDPDYVMLWAACCLAFFSFLHAGKFTVPSDSGYDASTPLSWGNLAVDDPASPGVLSIRLKASKTNPRKGIMLCIGKVLSDLCPVSAMLAYLLIRGRQAGLLFLFKDGKPLTRQRFVQAVHDALWGCQYPSRWLCRLQFLD